MIIKAAILVDNLSLTKWQKEAFDEAKKKIDVVLVLNCKNTTTKKRLFKHFLYYLLNIFSLKNIFTKREGLLASDAEIIDFDSEYSGMWQFIPKIIYDKLLEEEVNVVIKFGMSLLRIEERLSNISFLSFHHGDPSKYRGRPAGFYEILNGETTTGSIVQELNNELDAGKVLAFAESKVINFSYRKTSINFYGNSKYLLVKAIDNLSKGKEIDIEKNGINYRLPSNLIVVKFTLIMFINSIRKLTYGLFFEKHWKVALATNKLNFKGKEIISSKQLVDVPITQEYNFYADPFFSCNGSSIRLEALGNRSGLGDILEISIDDLTRQKKLLSGAHYSYPFSFLYNQKEYLLPEVANHSAQYIMSTDEKNNDIVYLKGLEDKRIVDATLIERNGVWFLFFGENSTAQTILNLWFSESPFGEFKAHPKTPVVISPKVARMGGGVLKTADRLLRFGQNNSGEYGESLSILEVKKLSITEYSEKDIGSIYIDAYKGPHSLSIDFNSNQILFDYYRDKFSLFAGVRRIKARLSKK